MRAGVTSRSWAMRPGSMGSSATMRMASMARSSSCMGLARVLLDGQRLQRHRLVAQPGDGEIAEVLGLVEVDQALLVELEDGQEAHDDGEALGQVLGQVA